MYLWPIYGYKKIETPLGTPKGHYTCLSLPLLVFKGLVWNVVSTPTAPFSHRVPSNGVREHNISATDLTSLRLIPSPAPQRYYVAGVFAQKLEIPFCNGKRPSLKGFRGQGQPKVFTGPPKCSLRNGGGRGFSSAMDKKLSDRTKQSSRSLAAPADFYC